jgi:hypothetical protein
MHRLRPASFRRWRESSSRGRARRTLWVRPTHVPTGLPSGRMRTRQTDPGRGHHRHMRCRRHRVGDGAGMSSTSRVGCSGHQRQSQSRGRRHRPIRAESIHASTGHSLAVPQCSTGRRRKAVAYDLRPLRMPAGTNGMAHDRKRDVPPEESARSRKPHRATQTVCRQADVATWPKQGRRDLPDRRASAR